MTSADQTATPDQTAGPDWSAARAQAGYWAQEIVGLIPPLCALGTAAFFQTQTMHMVFAWPWQTAWIPAACIEGGVAYFGLLYERHLVAGDSTLANRVWMLLCAAVSCATIYWHVTEQLHKPWQMAAVVGGMAALSLALWMRRSKWRRRELLRARGLIDAQVPRFSVARWVLCPIETPRAFRYAVKHSISDPRAALAEYRAEQTAGRAVSQTKASGTKSGHATQQTAKRPSRPAAQKTVETTRRADPTAQVSLRAMVGVADAESLRTIRKVHPTGLPTLGAIKAAITATGQTCGQTKAIRLRGLLEAEAEREQTTDPDRAAAAAN